MSNEGRMSKVVRSSSTQLTQQTRQKRSKEQESSEPRPVREQPLHHEEEPRFHVLVVVVQYAVESSAVRRCLHIAAFCPGHYSCRDSFRPPQTNNPLRPKLAISSTAKCRHRGQVPRLRIDGRLLGVNDTQRTTLKRLPQRT